MKKLLKIALIVCMFTLMVSSVSAFSGSGEGTEADPYQITTWGQLDEIRNDMVAGHYVLMNNLTPETLGYDTYASSNANGGAGWEPIGNNGADDGTDFYGSLEGNGHTISGLYINRDNTRQVALFGILGKLDTDTVTYIANLRLENINIIATGSNVEVGAFVGRMYESQLYNVSANGTIYAENYKRVGGLVGSMYRNYGQRIENSYSDVDIIAAYNYVAGIVGSLNVYKTGDVYINNTYATGSVPDAMNSSGLISMYAPDGIYHINNSFWDTQTTGQTTSYGGTGKTTSEMQNIDTFTDIATTGLNEPWNMKTVSNFNGTNSQWFIYDGNDYPHLYYESTPVINTAPSYEFENPSNGSTGITIPVSLSIDVTDSDGDSMNVSFYDASDDSLIGTDTNVLDGFEASYEWGGLSTCTTYSWYVNISDGTDITTTETYYFTTNCAPDAPVNPNPISGATNISLNPTMSAYFDDTDGDDLNITFFEETGPTDFIWCVVSNVPSDSRYSCDQSNLDAGTFYDWYVEVSDGLSTTTSDTWNFTTNHYPVLENVTIIDQSGETSYNFGESLGNITVDANDKEDGNTNAPIITIIGPDGGVRASAVPMNASTGNTYVYSTSISFDSVGEWTTNISITDSGGLKTNKVTNFTVQKTNVSSGGRIYGYDFERLPSFTEVNNSITEYDYFLVEIYVNKSSNWTKTSRLIQEMKNNSYITNLVWEEDLSDIDSSISYVQSNYQDLINQNHLNGMRHLKIRVDDGVAENTDNSENISQLAKAMFQEVENKFPIYLRDYNHTDINTNYITVDPYIYISENSKKKLINTEMSYLKNSTDKSRIYYNLTAPLQSYKSDWQSNIINKMRAGINTTSKYGRSNIAELNNGDIIVANPNSTEDSYNISTIGINTKNAYDLTDHSILDGNAKDSINITLPRESAHMVYFLNLTKTTINDEYFVYGSKR